MVMNVVLLLTFLSFATIYGNNIHLHYCVHLLEYMLDVKNIYFDISCYHLQSGSYSHSVV